MKKLLCGTSALVAVGLMAGGSAVAQEKKPTPVQLGLNGTFNAEFVFNDQDADDFREHGIQREAEVRFFGQTRLDNGLLIGVRVSLEAEVCADQIDESWIFFDGDNFGRVEIGSTDQAGWKMYYGAPTAIPNHSTSVNNIVDYNLPGPTRADFTIARLDLANDDEHITYFTPRFAGFQIGVSYTPDSCEENNSLPGTTGGGCGGSFGGLEPDGDPGQQSEIFEIAANYVGKFGDFSVAVYGAYAQANLEAQPILGINAGNGDDQTQYGLGFEVGFGGFTVGAAYREDNGGLDQNGDITDYNIGLRYVFGPWGLGVDYAVKEADSGQAGIGGEDELTILRLGATYLLGPGITLYAGVELFEIEDDTATVTATGAPAASADNDGTNFIIGTSLVF